MKKLLRNRDSRPAAPQVTLPLPKKTLLSSVSLAAACILLSTASYAQIGPTQTAAGTNRPLQLAPDSPFRDPDIIYLEADELINDEKAGVLTAKGEVEGRYQDRTLRADNVIYNLESGRVIATGNVILIDATGATQYADKLELSDELEAGTAANFTARIPGGGLTAARFVTRNENEEFDLYNAYYTACEVCKDSEGKTKKPSWRIKARKVSQDKDTRTIRYNDAVFEFLGVPVFYTPYLAHPDPSQDRASGFLTPFVGLSQSKGFNTRTPYYWAIDDHTEATFTPRIWTKVNPLMEYQFARKFHTGRVDVKGSFTYSSIFDRNGDAFTDPNAFLDPSTAPVGKRWRSHIYADGYFEPNSTWTYGFGVQLSTDDNYLNRYDLNETPNTRGLYDQESRRNTSQAFLIGQNDDFRLAVSAFGLQDLRSRIRRRSDGLFQVVSLDDGTLPIVAPKIEFEHYLTDPVVGGRLKTFGDFTALTRKSGEDYLRATAGLDYSKTFIAPGGIEVKPFGMGRFDQFELKPDDGSKSQFYRTLGQVGVDVRYPFIKPGKDVTWILEPRAQITQNFGNAKLDRFTISNEELFQDALNEDLDQALFWQSNKATGYDFWQEGLRADVGGAVRAEWGVGKYAELFLGQSYLDSNSDTVDFGLGSGLTGDKTDVVGQLSLSLGKRFTTHSRVRYDDDDNKFRRIDTSLNYRGDRVSFGGRYYKLNSEARNQLLDPSAPPEEVSGYVGLKLSENWRTQYKAYHDFDADITRRHTLSLTFQDDCTRIDFIYTRNNFDSDVIRDSNGFGIRVSLATLGDFSPE